jgi:hypothetical protein
MEETNPRLRLWKVEPSDYGTSFARLRLC